MSKFTFKKEKSNFQKSVSNIVLPSGIDSMNILSLSDYLYDATKNYVTNDIVCIIINDNPVWYVCSDNTTGEFLSDKIDGVETKVDSVNAKLVSLTNDVATVTTNLSTANRNINDISNNISTVKEQTDKIPTIISAQTTCNNNLLAMNSTVNTVKNDVSSIEESVGDLQECLDRLVPIDHDEIGRNIESTLSSLVTV